MAGSQKQKFLALLKILYEQTDEGHPLSAPQLVGLLAGQGISCERKAYLSAGLFLGQTAF